MSERASTPHLWIAGLVIVHQIVSYFWYSPYLFAFHWIDASGFRLSQLPPRGSFEYYLPFVLSVISSILLCYTLAWLYNRLRVHTLLQGLCWAVMLWLVFVLANTAVHHQFAQQSWSLTLIDGGRDLLLFALTGAALGARLQWKSSYE